MQRVLILLSVFVMLAAACGGSDTDAGQPATNAGGVWALASLTVDENNVPLPQNGIELEIDGSAVSGSAGCNSMGGTVDFSTDGSVTVSDLFWTEMACADQSLMDFESRYTSALLMIDSWERDADRLRLMGPNLELIYRPQIAAEDLPLIGTAWALDTFFDGESASHSADMDGITVMFTDTGTTASGRCWTISGFATIEPGDAGNLSVDFSSADPDFTCDERVLFAELVDRLSEVTEYEIVENRLILGTGDNPIVGFQG